MRKKTMVVAALATLVLAAPGGARTQRDLPWAGGVATVTELEAKLAETAAKLIGYAPQVHCNGAADWAALAAGGGFDQADVWGYVVFYPDYGAGIRKPYPYTHLSEQACLYLDGLYFAESKRSQKQCQAGTRPIFETQMRTRVVWRTTSVKKRARVGGKWVTRSVRARKRVEESYNVRVKVAEEPIFSVCSDWTRKLFAYQTIAHETLHLSGIEDEAVAECLGMQRIGWWMLELGAEPEFAKEVATDYWTLYQQIRAPGSAYHSSACVDGGSLDIFPDNAAWPAGFQVVDDRLLQDADAPLADVLASVAASQRLARSGWRSGRRIRIESDPGRGSTSSFELPAARTTRGDPEAASRVKIEVPSA